MLIMSYGGLRGAIAFALALVLDENTIERKKEFVTATIAVVFFTVFIQVELKFIHVRLRSIDFLGNYHRSSGEITQCPTKTDGRTDDVCKVSQSSKKFNPFE